MMDVLEELRNERDLAVHERDELRTKYLKQKDTLNQIVNLGIEAHRSQNIETHSYHLGMACGLASRCLEKCER